MAKRNTQAEDPKINPEEPIRDHEEDGGFKENTVDQPSPDEAMTEREMALHKEVMRMRNEQGSVLSLVNQMQRELAEVRKKTGVKRHVFQHTEEDGLAKLGTDYQGKIIIGWKMKPGTGVVLTPDGRVIDTQVVVYKNIDRVEGEAEYRQFYRMVSAGKIPCRIKNYLKRDSEDGFYRPTVKYKPDDLVRVVPGRYDGDPSDGVIVYDDEKEMEIAYRFLNP